MNVRSYNYEGFDFAAKAIESFDAPKAAHIPIQAPAPRPMFTTEDVELAKSLAREEGIREGQEHAKKQYEEEKNSSEAQIALTSAQALEKINAKLAELSEESESSRARFSERVGQLALAIAQKVCGDVSTEIIEKQISVIINESVARLDGADKIKIHLNAKNAAHLNNKFTIGEVVEDEKMQLGDFRIEWQNGFAQRDVKKLWQSISEICSRQSSLEENEPEELQEQTITKEGE